jgi:protein-S-isoprenylcysteine O-methyltransferase Ste14
MPQLGRRGGGWVVLQFAVIALVAVVGAVGPPWPNGASTVRVVLAVGLIGAGTAIGLLSARALGSSLTPFPHPTGGQTFVGHGPYRIVRHPIYFGGLLLLSGVSLLFSPWALAATAALGVLWAMKARVEERFLHDHYAEYAEYCRRTRFRLVPFVY